MKKIKKINGEVIFEYESQDDLIEKLIPHYANLRYANLRSANLRSANLRSANLSYANLRSANLRYADLRYADLRYADLSYADLSSADLRYADLSSADLSYADLSSAIGNGVELKSSQLGIFKISYSKDIFCIGCHCMTVSKWKRLSKKSIEALDSQALKYNEKYRDFILQMIDLFPAE